MKKQELIKYLDEYLNINDFKDVDDSANGLQIDSEKDQITKIGYAVDSSNYIFDKAVTEKVDMVISHHGLFWGHEAVLTGLPFERANKLIKNNICSYACHLPLDAHKEIGNNIGLLKAFINIFGLKNTEYKIEEFLEYKGKIIGYGLKFNNKMHISNLVTPYAERMGLLKKLYNFGDLTNFSSIAFVSGGALSEVQQVTKEGYDIYLTGEGVHHEMILSKELGQTVLIGGHYETEKIGPKLLAYHLRDKFNIEIVFLDEKY